MNGQDFNTLVRHTVEDIQTLLIVKGGEYANSEDRLANFKRGASLTGCTPEQVCFIYLSKHYDGIASYVSTTAKGKARVSSEPIEGRIDDLINYCLLLKGLISERRSTESANEPPRDGLVDYNRSAGSSNNPAPSIPTLGHPRPT